MKVDTTTYRLEERGRLHVFGAVIFIIGLAASIGGYAIDARQFFHSWLTAALFWFTVAAGGLFFTMLHHLIGSTWSVVLRRMGEAIMSVLPFMLLFFIPILFNLDQLYHWAHEGAAEHDHLLAWKEPYLNEPFFFIRFAGYFVVWMVLYLLLFRSSLRQDSGHSRGIQSTFMRISAPGMILFALTFSFASFDWLMSMEPHWYSTIFGVYIFAGAVVGVITFMTLVGIWLFSNGAMSQCLTGEHFHDLGKLLFAFTVFWAYMAFSQYFLIWYGNIPEETVWFRERWTGSWKTISLILVFGNFVIPFLILITRIAKRNLYVLGFMAIWLLVMHYIDLHWIVMPMLHPEGFVLHWMDVTTFLAVGGFFIAKFWYTFSGHPLVPVGDPKLEQSIQSVS